MTVNRARVRRFVLFFIIGGALVAGFVNCGRDFVTSNQDSASTLASQSTPTPTPTPASGPTPTPNPTSTPTPTPSRTPSGTLSPGCGNAGAATGYTTVSTTDGNKTKRTFDLEVTSSYKSSTPMALTILFHGAGGTSADARGFGLDQISAAVASTIMVYPQGIPFQSYGVGWDDTCGGYDMPFFDNIITYVENNYCVDENRVFVGGFSWGCDFVTALACCRASGIRAVAAGSCSDEFSDPSNYKTYNNVCPASTNHPAIRFTHAPSGDGAYPAPLFATTSQLYQSFNSCTNSNTTSVSPSPCVSYTSCKSPFIECADAVGHSLPANWNTDTWNFLSQFQ